MTDVAGAVWPNVSAANQKKLFDPIGYDDRTDVMKTTPDAIDDVVRSKPAQLLNRPKGLTRARPATP